MDTPVTVHRPVEAIWKVMAVSMFTFLLGVFGAGAFAHFEQSALEIRTQQAELTLGVTSQRLTEIEKREAEMERHIDSNDSQIQMMREKLARQQRGLNQ